MKAGVVSWIFFIFHNFITYVWVFSSQMCFEKIVLFGIVAAHKMLFPDLLLPRVFLAIFQRPERPRPARHSNKSEKNNSVAMFSFWIQVLQCLDGKTWFFFASFHVKQKHTCIYIRTWAGCTFCGSWRPITALDYSYHLKTHWALLLEYNATIRFAHICNVNDYICFQHLGNTQFTFAFQILKNTKSKD